ncbi:fructose-bisphosphate aldolase, class II/tagatose 1,6-diphosphate aldolase GatY/KbaY [Fodinibius roseus]|uniref:Fructose-bisphosphate aldolase, class II/tagatose 1,6-diphosphate aldolase GatY/KbaY n=1 Tax=Fodinibius roseus TaxID=1194090 RepID=A0A1M5JJJ0_9BACT|nr:class II fructose-bisphosphate aldolase [Fodinibius roseus]SHG40732.1 fructose-bisphosphate aldolase, class II/tagatose 1,6-diphosphate aldolase GatY/KbaY [Fodinibius roseus]
MTLQQKFKELENEGSALLATNFYNFETITGVLQAASAKEMPLILQASPSTINYLGAGVAASLARSTMKKHGVEGWLHLDHAESYELIEECLDEGFDSVMIDASEKSFDENVAITSRVTELARSYGANVEAELGYVAKLGQSHEREGFTKPDEARKFVEQTGVDALAVAIGSAHGFYKKEPDLDLERLEQIHRATSCALVLHGGSGIPDTQLQQGIRLGIRKINVATEIKNIFMKTLQEELQQNTEIDLRKVFPPATEKINHLVQGKMAIIKGAKTA